MHAAPLAGRLVVSTTPVTVMLPLDTVTSDGVFRYATAPWFSQALGMLAMTGVEGVAIDLWWGAIEREPRVYSWGGYKQLFDLIKQTGLKLQVVLSFHACGGNVGDTTQIPLPSWVLQCAEADPDLFFTDRPRMSGRGQRNPEYLSIWADDAAGALCGRSPMQCYEDFMLAFRDTFSQELGVLVEDVVLGSGPCGELRYPSYVEANGWRFPGVGEFQCYDRRALASLAQAAREAGHPEWGYTGPHDAGSYNSGPEDCGFFSPEGSWDSDYGRFFLGWYSSCLLRHGDRLLSLASSIFAGKMQPRTHLPAGLSPQPRLTDTGATSPHLSSNASHGTSSPLGSLAQEAVPMSGISDGQLGRAGFSPSSSVPQHPAGTPRSAGVADGCGSNNNSSNSLLPHVIGRSLQQARNLLQGLSHAHSSAPAHPQSSSLPLLSSTTAATATTTAAPPMPRESCGVTSAPGSTCASHSSAAAQSRTLAGGAALQLTQGRYSLSSGVITGDGGSASSLSPTVSGMHGVAIGGSGGDGRGTSAGQSIGGDDVGGGSSLSPADSSCNGQLGGSLPLASDTSGLAAFDDALGDSIGLSFASCEEAEDLFHLPHSDGHHLTSTARPGASSVHVAAHACGVGGSIAAGADSDSASIQDPQRQQRCSNASSSAGLLGQPRGPSSSASGAASQALSHPHPRTGTVHSEPGNHSHLSSSSGSGAMQSTGPAGVAGNGLSLTLKVAGIHWWYRSMSHAAELTAGYYNTDQHDGYGPILALCARHGVGVTLTCVEMCDAQHPIGAMCGPEGLLRQVRTLAAKHGVPLNGENALPIFLLHTVDTTALDRIVANTRAWGPPPRHAHSLTLPSHPTPCNLALQGQLSLQPTYQYGSSITSSGYSLGGSGNGSVAPGGTSHGQHQHGGAVQAGNDSFSRQSSDSNRLHYSHSASSTLGCSSHHDSAGIGIPCHGLPNMYHSNPAHTHGHGQFVHGHGHNQYGYSYKHMPSCTPIHQAFSAQQLHLLRLSSDDGSSGGTGGLMKGFETAGGLGGGRNLVAAANGSTQFVEPGMALSSPDYLPPMRSFTFLRLGPQLLQPMYQMAWMKFMHRMQG